VESTEVVYEGKVEISELRCWKTSWKREPLLLDIVA
jgi:hypothetical protein